MTGLDLSNFGLVIFFVLAITLFLVIRGARHLLGLARLSRSRRAAIDKAWPVAEALIWLFFLVSGLPLIFVESPSYTPVVVGAFMIGMVWFARAAIGDFVDGVFLRASQALSHGDDVSIDGQSGTVRKLGYRALTIETRDGDEVAIPYSRISRDTIVRSTQVEGAARHTFDLPAVTSMSTTSVHAAIVRAAMDCHWSSTAREPRVEFTPNGFEIVVFSLDCERGPDIEAAVRQVFADL